MRGHLTEFGYIVRQGVGHVAKLIEIVGDPTSDVPAQARPVLAIIAESLQALQAQIVLLDREIASRTKADPVARRLMTINIRRPSSSRFADSAHSNSIKEIAAAILT